MNENEHTIRALADSALKRLTSDVICQRGWDYAASGAVEILSESAMPRPGVQARVVGTHPYATEVWIDEDGPDGACDCPNAAEGWFCKHQVAVAIVWRHRLAGEAIVVDQAANPEIAARARRARTASDNRKALLEFLNGQDASTLAARLMALADRDRSISSDLQRWRKVAAASDRPSDLKPLITELLSVTHEFIGWSETHAYVRRAEAILPPLRVLVANDPSKAMSLCLHALRRAWRALASADDSNGEIGSLCEAIGAEWVKALEAAGPHPTKIGETYLQIRLEQPMDCFDSVAAELAIGEPAMTRYRQLLSARWRAAKDAVLTLQTERAAKAAVRKGRASGYERPSDMELVLPELEQLHLQQLESDGQVDEAVAVLREDLSTAEAYRGLVNFLDAHGRYREALNASEQGVKTFPNDWELQVCLLQCYERDGWTDEALALRGKHFKLLPDVRSFHAVLNAARMAGRDDVAIRQEMLDWLASDEMRGGSGRDDRRARDVTLRAAILCSEERWLEASALVEPPAKCQERIVVDIAEHLPADHEHRALVLLLRVFDHVMVTAVNPYQGELHLVAKIVARMSHDRREPWLGELRKVYKAKRNFIAGLSRV